MLYACYTYLHYLYFLAYTGSLCDSFYHIVICILYMLLLKQRDISISIPAKINGLVVEKPQM